MMIMKKSTKALKVDKNQRFCIIEDPVVRGPVNHLECT